MSAEILASSSGSVPKVSRVASIDALRGFDMLWIVGLDALATTICRKIDTPWSHTLAEQLEHVPWEGFRFYDLIFPLFLFLVGCVIPFSLEKYRDTPSAVYVRIARRTLMLFLFGLIANGLLRLNWPEMRYAGVLQRIGICYGCASLIFLHTRTRGQVAILVAILLGYWALIGLVPSDVTSVSNGTLPAVFSKEGNLSGRVDRAVLPGKILDEYYGDGDNEGILSTIPAIATPLLGILAGTWLRSANSGAIKLFGLIAAGLVSLALGYGWNPWFPIIKNIWSSSFVLVAGGWSFLLLALFYGIIDLLGWKRWAFVFTVVGMNAITIYMAQNFIDFAFTAKYFLGGVATLFGDWSSVVLLAGTLACEWLFLYFLYRQKVYLRV